MMFEVNHRTSLDKLKSLVYVIIRIFEIKIIIKKRNSTFFHPITKRALITLRFPPI